MKYKDLIQFDPITSVIKLVDSAEIKQASQLVKTFVFSQKIKRDIKTVILKNLVPNAGYETFGIQVVGNHGTGKSHLMSLVASIAENATLLNELADDELKESFKPIAGKYKVLRFELGSTAILKDIVFSNIERYINQQGVDFTFDPKSPFSWKENLQDMMAAFENKFPQEHFLIVIDEVLEYLRGRGPTDLYNDLSILRQLGELCDNSRFKIMFGVQELLYRSPEFQFQADMLSRISERYSDLIITREDVSFVVKERLLKKDLHQKSIIREHLLKFSHLFEGINGNPNEYIDLYPVHPGYITNFEQIRHGKNQREILKVLSKKFESLNETDIPDNNPGLITYDTYWNDLAGNSDMLSKPDIGKVKDNMDIIVDRIQNHFTGARSNRKELAMRIASALAIRILSDDLDKRNGASGTSLKEQLCVTLPAVDDPELLTAAVDNTAKHLVSATGGQYVSQDEISGEYYIRTEGGINVPQLIRDYADEVIKRSPQQADQYFFEFLQFLLEIQQNTYRTGFKIWPKIIEWPDRKSFRRGYIFFGNPNERSTTEPVQHFYIFFSPLFSSIQRNDQPDEVYFELSGLSNEFKDTICLYGAGKAKMASAQSNLKPLFMSQIEEFQRKALTLFDREFADKTDVIYKGVARSLKTFQLPGDGATKEMIFKNVASKLLNSHFNDIFPNYPVFSDLRYALTDENLTNAVSGALKKIVAPLQPNREGEAILSGLGLWSGQNIELSNSKYAGSILEQLKKRGENAVLNRQEILYAHFVQHNLWYSVDFNIDYQLQFVVLAALAFKGEIEITWSGSKTLSATNIETALGLSTDDYFTFQHVKQPQGIPVKHLKALFGLLGLPDYTSELDKPETISKIITEARNRVETVVKTKALVAQGIRCRTIALMPDTEAETIKNNLQELATLLDNIQSYNTYGKLKAFRFTDDEMTRKFEAWAWCSQVEKLRGKAEKFEKLAGYLYSAQSYIPETEPLYTETGDALTQLPARLTADNEVMLRQYETLLNSLIDRYADFYLAQYAKRRISKADAMTKERLMKSDEKRICDIIKDSEFVNAAEYQQWINQVTSLREADIMLTKARVMQEPYHDFNPREYAGKPLFKINDLEEQLSGLADKWTLSMRVVLKDPTVQDNLDMLKAGDRDMVEAFASGQTGLTTASAGPLRNLITQLAQGIDKVEVSPDDFRKTLSKPLTPQEAIDTFTAYINSLCAGKERNKVRIIIK
jgi:hypothetical protein